LSAGVPITSYKDVTFQQSSGTLEQNQSCYRPER
jgi:hypothetical protein